jgi:hypothetical protein
MDSVVTSTEDSKLDGGWRRGAQLEISMLFLSLIYRSLTHVNYAWYFLTAVCLELLSKV